MTTILKNSTKKAQGYIRQYKNCLMENYPKNWSVNNFYKNCSNNKREAEASIKRWMQEMQGKNFRVLSGNCHTFTCAFRSGSLLYVFTKDYNYTIPGVFEND